MIEILLRLCWLVLIVGLFFQCGRKNSVSVVENNTPQEVVDEPITYDQPTDRNDVPPPPSSPWWTINTEELTVCQKTIWAYLKKMYPMRDSTNLEYQLYTLKNQNDYIGSHFYLQNLFAEYFTLDFPQNYLYNSEYNCGKELNANFFEDALGEPTCVANNYQDSVVTYLYYVKMRFRNGPCPFTQHQGEVIGNYCSVLQTEYCSSLRAMFSMQTGNLVYIDFMR